MTIFATAADDRASGYRAPADRPSQRRCAEALGARAVVLAPLTRAEVRDAADGSGLLDFTGYASVVERGYEMWDMFGPYTEVVAADAFNETLARAGLDVPLVLGHDQLRRIARTTTGTLSLAMDETGLRVSAPKLDPADADVAYIAPKLRSGLIDEMSFAFRIDAGQWSPDYTEFRITKVDIHRGDVAIVGYGANPFTAGSGLRAESAPTIVRDLGITDADLAVRSSLI